MYKINFTANAILLILTLPLIIQAQYELKIGNFWIYNNDYTEEKISIIDTVTLFDSLLYYETHLLTNSKNNTFVHDSSKHFRRKKSNGFFENLSIYYNPNDTVISEDVFYKYNAQLGDKWIYRISNDGTPYDTVWAEVVDVIAGIVFGEWRTVKKIRYRTGFDFFKYFSDDFGELSEEGYDYVSHVLRGCYIDSVTYGDTSFVVVSVEDDLIPSEFLLSQNYPNPFNPTTTIEYYLPTYSKVRLVIYNSLGQEVETLVSEFQTSGEYRVQFNASGYSTGVYFYSLITDNNKLTRKMLLLT